MTRHATSVTMRYRERFIVEVHNHVGMVIPFHRSIPSNKDARLCLPLLLTHFFSVVKQLDTCLCPKCYIADSGCLLTECVRLLFKEMIQNKYTLDD